MIQEPFPIPDLLPTFLAEPPLDLANRALQIYRQVAEQTGRLAECERQASQALASQIRDSNQLIARLAGQRFELERLLKRLAGELAKPEFQPLAKVLDLFMRSWDAELSRNQIEVQDLAKRILDDALAEVVEVESALPDPSVQQALVKETLTPLVLYQNQVIGIARVITAVPTYDGEETERQEEIP